MSPKAKLRALRTAWIVCIWAAAGCCSALYLIAANEPAGVVLLDQLGPGYRAYWLLGVCLLLSFAVSIPSRRRILSARQERNELAAGQLLESLRTGNAIKHRSFFVYLRSFETTGHLKPPFFFTMAVLQRLHTNELESFLTLALEKRGPLVGLGLPGENVGAARIRVENTTWKADIQRLLTNAAGVLVIPSAHEGTKWEIEVLQKENLLRKSVFIMPPKTRQFDWGIKWEQAAQALQQFNITLPEYNERGLLFSLGMDGQLADARVFSLLYRRSIRKSIEELLSGTRKSKSGQDSVEKAKRRSRVIWSFGRWGALTGILTTPFFLWFGMSEVFAGRAPRGVDPPPRWSTFLARYDSASEVGSGQSLARYGSEAMSHGWMTEGAIDQLAKQGLTRVGDYEREVYLLGLGEMLSYAPSEQVCAALAEGRASETDRIRALVMMPRRDINLWMDARQKAVLAALRKWPVIVRAAEPGPDLTTALSAVLGWRIASEIGPLLTARRKLTDKEACILGIQGAAAIDRLEEPGRAHMATALANTF